VWRETLRWVWTALSERVKLLFAPTLELVALLLLLPTIRRVVQLLNRPDVPSESYAQDELLGGPDPMLPISTMGCWRLSR
jgi:hypothetical protein